MCIRVERWPGEAAIKQWWLDGHTAPEDADDTERARLKDEHRKVAVDKWYAPKKRKKPSS